MIRPAFLLDMGDETLNAGGGGTMALGTGLPIKKKLPGALTGLEAGATQAPLGMNIAPPSSPAGMASLGGAGQGGQPTQAPLGMNIAPPTTTAPMATPGATTFGQTNNLIGTQFNPDVSQRLGQTQGLVNNAATGYANTTLPQFGQIAGSDFSKAQGGLDQAGKIAGQGLGQSALTGQATDATSQGLAGLNNAPSRQDLANQSLESLGNVEQAKLQSGLRAAGQRAASLGRLGGGEDLTGFGGLFGEYNTKIADIKRQLATDTAGQELGDRLAKLNASSGILGQSQGQDLAKGNFGLNQAGQLGSLAGQQAGLTSAGRNEQLGERQFGADQGLANANLKQQQLGQLGNLETQQFGQDLTNRNELRGERGYQNDLQQQALGNRLGQHQQEQADQQQAFGQQNANNSLLANLGFGGDTAGTIGGQADQYGQNAQSAQGGAGDLLKNYFANQGPQGVTSALGGAPQGTRTQAAGTPFLSAKVDEWKRAGVPDAQIQQLLASMGRSG